MPFSNLVIQNPYESQIGTPIFLSISKDQNVSLKNKKRGTFSKTDRIFFSSSIQLSFVIFTSFVLSFPMHCSLTLKKPFCIFFISLSLLFPTSCQCETWVCFRTVFRLKRNGVLKNLGVQTTATPLFLCELPPSKDLFCAQSFKKRFEIQ